MGVKGLLGILKSIQRPIHLKTLNGQTLGIDAYGWLHRGVSACPIELALGIPTRKHIDFCVNKVRMLLDFGITPYLVFDGDAVPSKAGTNEERRQSRAAAKISGLELYKAGRKLEAHKELQKAAAVTPAMARDFIEALKIMNVPYVVAPFEADAQLVYLERKNIIHGILAEDSDMLVFGAQRLLTKLDQYGNCFEIRRKDFGMCKDVSLAGWTDSMFTWMCIFSGCDYLPSLGGIGIRTAYDLIQKSKDPNKAIRMLAFKGKPFVPPDYETKFRNAELTFLHHRVFCPISKRMVFLNDLACDQKEEDLPFLGAYVEPEIAIDVARGHLNPKTKEPLQPTPSGIRFYRPNLRDNRRQTLATPNDLKSEKPLDRFFQPQPSRRPLAELDPNTLTPSPSQQRVLERNTNVSWEPLFLRTVQSEPSARSRSMRVYMDQNPTPSTEHRRAYLETASRVTPHNPVKRLRLCSESGETTSKDNVTRSPFFASSIQNASPLAMKKTRERKTRKSEFDVWSDDSVEEAMLALHDAKPGPHHLGGDIVSDMGSSKTPALPSQDSAISEKSIRESQSFSTTNDSQSSHGTSRLRELDIETGNDPQTSFDNSKPVNVLDQPGWYQPMLSKLGNAAPHKKVNRTFSTQSTSTQLAALKSLSGSPNHEKSPTEDSIETKSPSGSALITPKVSKASLTRTFVYQSPERQIEALSSLKAIQSVTETPISKRNVEMTLPANLFYGISGAAGSEDALVPNSEDDVSEAGDIEFKPPTLDLKAFVYTS